jgi:hypothetical protein
LISLIPSIFVLGAAALAAAWLASSRSPGESEDARASASRTLAVVTVLQGLHFSEESAGGFPESLGDLFGLPPMSFSFFLVFNLAWLAVWIVSVPGIRAGNRLAFFAAWFLAIAGVANGILHPVLAIFSWGYFPGLITAPFVGYAAYRLFRSLERATH